MTKLSCTGTWRQKLSFCSCELLYFHTNLRLNQSRSQRILWLLEELNLDYELKIYKRDKGHRAPPELEKVHPLGKSPVLEVIRDGKSLVIAETGHIIEYLIKNYDTSKKLVPATEEEKEQVDYFLHYCEGTLQPYLVGLLVHGMAVNMAPFPVKFLVRMIMNEINKAYYKSGLMQNLKFLDDYLAKNKSKYFVGDKLTGADIIFEFPLIENLADNKRIKEFAGDDFDIRKLFPNICEWADRMLQEPKLIKANEKAAKL